MPPNTGHILVIGACGELGYRLCLEAQKAGYKVTGSWRRQDPSRLHNLAALNIDTVSLDITDTESLMNLSAQFDCIIFTPILSVSGPAMRALVNKHQSDRRSVQKIILFSSNNVMLDHQAPIYKTLRQEEAKIKRLNGHWVILRPTMIYGYKGDGNFSSLMNLAQKWPILPLMGQGKSRQQPLHIDDLVNCTLSVVQNNETEQEIYSIGGRGVYKMQEVYSQILQALNYDKPIIRLPLKALKPLLQLAETLGLTMPITSKQVARADLDKLPMGPAPDFWQPEISLKQGLKRLADECHRASE